VPSARRFAAGALASAVAVFGVLALRVHAGDDPALGHAKAKASTGSGSPVTQRSQPSSGASSIDPYDTGTSATDGAATSPDQSSPGSGSSSGDAASPAAAPTTRAS
jgi:hypothetical protein